jgi:major membrane immunogen (membrane-anchored lipoprotein)
LPAPAATGRPRRFCRAVCRQRNFEASQRAAEAGLTEAELVVARRELEDLSDQLYVLEAAIEDVDHDLTGTPSKQEYVDAVNWLLQAARPLVGRRLGATR